MRLGHWVLLVLACIVACAWSPAAKALPQFSLLTGNRCLNCHVAPQGGGLRDELGWYSMKGVSLIEPSVFGMSDDEERLALFDGNVAFGLDFRLQRARSHKSSDAESKIFPMQATISGAFTVTDWATIVGSYNVGAKKRYNGQQSATAFAVVQPDYSYPTLQAGFFQPSIGIRYDDHTMLVRQIAGAAGVPLIAPDYAELGAELTYNSLKWLSITAGAFSASSLSENIVTGRDTASHSLVDKNSVSVIGRVVVSPRAFDNELNTYAGISVFANGDFTLSNVFAGVGLTDDIALMAEYAYSNKKDLRTTDNFSIDLSWQALDALSVYVRGERGVTTLTYSGSPIEEYTNQFVLGTQLFVLPGVEFRPEYRWVDTEAFTSTRYAVQLHLFY